MANKVTFPETDFIDPDQGGSRFPHLRTLLSSFCNVGHFPVRNSCIVALKRALEEDGSLGNHTNLNEICDMFEKGVLGVLQCYTPEAARVLGAPGRTHFQQKWYGDALDCLLRAYLNSASWHAVTRSSEPLVRAIQFVVTCQQGTVKPLSDGEALKHVLFYARGLRAQVSLHEFLSSYVNRCADHLCGEGEVVGKDFDHAAPVRRIIEFMWSRKYFPSPLLKPFLQLGNLAHMRRAKYLGAPETLPDVEKAVIFGELEMKCHVIALAITKPGRK